MDTKRKPLKNYQGLVDKLSERFSKPMRFGKAKTKEDAMKNRQSFKKGASKVMDPMNSFFRSNPSNKMKNIK